jgi:hypothetical protein
MRESIHFEVVIGRTEGVDESHIDGGVTIRSEGDGGSQPRIPRYVDWLVAGILALIGLAFAVGGAALFVLADVELIAEGVEAGTIRSDVFSGETLVDVTYAVAWWSGVGLLVTGVVTWLTAIGFAVYRRRAHRRQETTGEVLRSARTNALVGAAASVVLGFVPFSPVLGGVVAGYLANGERATSLKVGGLSGVFAAVPVVLVLAFVFVGLTVGTMGTNGSSALALFGVVLGVVAILFGVLFTAALGAVGGFVGGTLAPDD